MINSTLTFDRYTTRRIVSTTLVQKPGEGSEVNFLNSIGVYTSKSIESAKSITSKKSRARSRNGLSV